MRSGLQLILPRINHVLRRQNREEPRIIPARLHVPYLSLTCSRSWVRDSGRGGKRDRHVCVGDWDWVENVPWHPFHAIIVSHGCRETCLGWDDGAGEAGVEMLLGVEYYDLVWGVGETSRARDQVAGWIGEDVVAGDLGLVVSWVVEFEDFGVVVAVYMVRGMMEKSRERG